MSTAVAKLLVVQEHDSRIREINKELQDIPARKEEEEAKLAGHKELLAQIQEDLKAKQAEVKKLELETEARREKIAKLRQQQLELKTNKEFKAMEAEIKVIEDEISDLEEQELGELEEIEKARAEAEENKKKLLEEETAVQSDLRALNERVSSIEVELKEVQAARDSAASEVDPEWLRMYEPIFKRKGKGLVPVEGEVCGGCHMQLPPYILHDRKKEAVMVTCDHCGRLLY